MFGGRRAWLPSEARGSFVLTLRGAPLRIVGIVAAAQTEPAVIRAIFAVCGQAPNRKVRVRPEAAPSYFRVS